MRRKTVIAAVTVAMAFLTATAMVGTQLHLTQANFLFYPSNPHTTIVSPTNGTYNKNSLSLEVNITTYKTAYEQNGVNRQFTYVLDNNEPEAITITNSSIGTNPGTPVCFLGTAVLDNLTEGAHYLVVHVVFDYIPTEYSKEGFQTQSVEFVTFIIDTAEESPTAGSKQIPTIYLPYAPHTIVQVQSTNNSHYSSGNIQLEFTINMSLWAPPLSSNFSYSPSFFCSLSSIKYYVDNQSGVEINQDITRLTGTINNLTLELNGLSIGEHTIELKTSTNGLYLVKAYERVIDNQTYSYWNKFITPVEDFSGKVSFLVEQLAQTMTAEPSSAPTPSPTPTQKPTLESTVAPTLEPILTPIPTAENSPTQDFTLPIVLAAVIGVAVAIAALVYLKRRRKH